LTPLSRESNDWLDYKVYQAFNQIDTNHICVIVPKLSASEHSLGKTTMTAFSDAENGLQAKGSQEPNYPYPLAKRRKGGSGTKAKRRDGC
jgi:hypothetical protein